MTGRAIILASGTVIAPFGDPAALAFFSGERLKETQDRAFSKLGLEVLRVASPAEAIELVKSAPAGPVVLLLDRLYVSEKAAADFLKATKKLKSPVALALAVDASVEYTRPLSSVVNESSQIVHDMVRVDGADLPAATNDAAAWLRTIVGGARRALVPKRVIVVDIPLPVIPSQDDPRPILRYPVTSTIVCSIEHWVHVLWLNQIAFGIRWMELLRKRPLWALFRVLLGFAFTRERLLLRLVRRGRGVKIHPTAHVSGSILGDGVVVGPQATVRNSILGPGVIVSDHAVLLNSVIGDRTLVTENTFGVSIVTYPDATVGNYKFQMCLVGEGAYINPWAGFVDAKFIGHVKVSHHGALVSTERAFLGSCVGHRARVAAKVLIQSGREIPNDTVIVMRPDEVVSEVPKDMPAGQPHVRDRGTLVPLGQEGGAR